MISTNHKTNLASLQQDGANRSVKIRVKLEGS